MLVPHCRIPHAHSRTSCHLTVSVPFITLINILPMSLDNLNDLDSTSSASTLTLLDDDSFKSELLSMISGTAPETNHESKRFAKSILRDNASSLTSIHPYEIDTYKLLDAMIDGSEQAGLLTGSHYAVCAIIAADRKAKMSNSTSSAPELMKLAHDWLHFLLWPCMQV